NRDGKLDLAVANLASDTVSILIGDGDGTFQTAVNYPVGSSPVAIAVGDFTGDGPLDLAGVGSGAGGGPGGGGVLLGRGGAAAARSGAPSTTPPARTLQRSRKGTSPAMANSTWPWPIRAHGTSPPG